MNFISSVFGPTSFIVAKQKFTEISLLMIFIHYWNGALIYQKLQSRIPICSYKNFLIIAFNFSLTSYNAKIVATPQA
jgi:hypothetical protein